MAVEGTVLDGVFCKLKRIDLCSPVRFPVVVECGPSTLVNVLIVDKDDYAITQSFPPER